MSNSRKITTIKQARLNFELILKARLREASRDVMKNGASVKDASRNAGVPETTLRRHLGLVKRNDKER